MKKLILCVFFIAACQVLIAQNSISGKVFDKNGNPVAGARISAPDGSSTTTNLDGEFIIVAEPDSKMSVEYVGMSKASFKAKEYNEVFLKNSRGGAWMVMGSWSPIGYNKSSVRLVENSNQNSGFGLTVGYLSTIGGYASIRTNKFGKARINQTDTFASPEEYMFPYDKPEFTYFTVTAGVTAKVLPWLYPYAGIGYGNRHLYWLDSASESIVHMKEYSNIAFEGGLIFRISYACIGLGVSNLPATSVKSMLVLSAGVNF